MPTDTPGFGVEHAWWAGHRPSDHAEETMPGLAYATALPLDRRHHMSVRRGGMANGRANQRVCQAADRAAG